MNKETLKGQINALHSGDETAFTAIYQELKTPVYTIIFRILYDRALTEDVMQDVFLKLFRSPPDFHVKHPRAWIFQMARNLAIDTKRKRTLSAMPEEMEDPALSVADLVSTRIDIEEAIQKLSDDAIEIVTLHLSADLKFKEIAEILKMPIGTVIWKYQKAISGLRSQLSGGTL